MTGILANVRDTRKAAVKKVDTIVGATLYWLLHFSSLLDSGEANTHFQSSITCGILKEKASHINDRFHGRPSAKGNFINPNAWTIPNMPPNPSVSTPTDRSTLYPPVSL